jgi:hypothetical protein
VYVVGAPGIGGGVGKVPVAGIVVVTIGAGAPITRVGETGGGGIGIAGVSVATETDVVAGAAGVAARTAGAVGVGSGGFSRVHADALIAIIAIAVKKIKRFIAQPPW